MTTGGYKVSFWGNENVLKSNYGGDWSTLIILRTNELYTLSG